MSLQRTGNDIELVRNDNNGLYDIAWSTTGANKGNPIFGNTRSHTMLSLLLSRRGEYYWDNTGTRGSLLHTIKQDVLATRSQLISYSEQAIQPAIDSKVIQSFSADATKIRSGSWSLTFNWSNPTSSFENNLRI